MGFPDQSKSMLIDAEHFEDETSRPERSFSEEAELRRYLADLERTRASEATPQVSWYSIAARDSTPRRHSTPPNPKCRRWETESADSRSNTDPPKHWTVFRRGRKKAATLEQVRDMISMPATSSPPSPPTSSHSESFTPSCSDCATPETVT